MHQLQIRSSHRNSSRYPHCVSAWFLAAVTCLTFCLIALPSGGAIANYTVKVWDTESGLPSSTVTGVSQSPDGYLWISTINGLARFDGVSFTTFVGPESNGLRVGGFNQILVDSLGDIWARMENGNLVFRNPVGFTNLDMDGSFRNLYAANDGTVWATSHSGAIVRCEHGELRTIPRSEQFGGLSCAPISLSNGTQWFISPSGNLLKSDGNGIIENLGVNNFEAKRCLSVAKVGTDSVWILTDNAIWEAGKGKLKPVKLPVQSTLEFKGLKAGVDGDVWLWSSSKVWHLLKGTWNELQNETQASDVNFNQNLSLVDRDGRIWFGTSGQGLVGIAGDGKKSLITMREGLPSNYILSLAQDHEGNIWAGTRRGLVRIKQTQIKVVSWDYSQSESVATGLASDSGGRMWIGSDSDGLFWYNDVDNHSKPHSYSAKPKSVRALAQDHQERLWVGTVREGLWVIDKGQPNQVLYDQLANGEARSLLVGADNCLWIGGTKGLFAWSKDKLVSFLPPSGIVEIDVRAMSENDDGSIWVGTQGQGLWQFHDHLWERAKDPRLAESATVWCLFKDLQGNLWIGTGGHGLLRLREGKFESLNQTDGLPVETIYSILEDDADNLWLGTHSGIIRLNKNDCNDVINHRDKKLTVTIFNRSDGMPTVQCASGFQPNACRTQDGCLWFATDKGVVRVDPKIKMPSGLPPNVVIENIFVRSQPIGAASGLKIDPLPRQIKFQFTALSFTAPERVRFRYRLDGEDKEWVDVNTDRTVVLNTLSPGEHVFRVIACNSDGVWNTEGASLNFTVLPAWWQTFWFKLIAGSLIISVVVGIGWKVAAHRYNKRLEEVKRQGALERERARIARDIHDELGSSLTRIVMLSQPPDDDGIPSELDLANIHKTACNLTRAMDEVVWAVNPRQDTLEGLMSYVTLFAQEFITSAKLDCRLDLPESIPSLPVAAEARHNLFLAAKEAIHNAVRHARAKEIRISLVLDQAKFILEISDNGTGFEQSRRARSQGGHGLKNMEERLKSVGGICQIHSVIHQGTSVKFTVPLPNPGIV